MRPGLPDIAVPPLPARLRWVGTDRPPRIERLIAVGPVLVHFFDFAQLNSVRALPYINRWSATYRDHGVSVLGIHTPRYPFTAPRKAVAEAADRLGIEHPVAVDSELRVWRAYGCEGWPSTFLWGRGGTLRWFHFGEGEYRSTEEAIQELVLESDPGARLPGPLAPLRATDAPGALVVPPSDEVFPGGSVAESWQAGPDGDAIELEYAGGGACASTDGEGAIEVALDGRALDPVAVDFPGLQELTAHERHETHRLAVRPSPGVRLWSLSFPPGMP